MDVMKMFPIFDQSFGLMMIAAYALFVFGLTTLFASGYDKTKEAYLVANRNVGYLQGSMSVGASWIWAPGLFVAAQQAYNNGIAGLFWFSFGNFLALIVFSFAIYRLRNKVSDGFTLSQWFRQRYGPVAQGLIVLTTVLYALQGLTINLFAGSKSVTLLTGLSPLLVSVLLVGIAALYSWRGGLKAGIVTDVTKVIAIWVGVGLTAVILFSKIGFEPALAGIGGKTGEGVTLFGSPFAWGLFFGFGLPTVAGHFASPWNDNSNYQNAYSMKKEVVRKAFITAPFYWLILPIVGGLIGLSAAGLKYAVDGPNSSFINLIVMANEVGWWLPMIYLAVVFAGLVSIIDTQLLSSANIAGNDLADAAKSEDSISWSKVGMIVLAVLGVALANIPGLDLNTIFVFGKTLALTLFVPIVLALMFDDFLNKQGFIAGGAVGFLVGAPVFAYGQLLGGGPQIMALGIAIQIIGSGVVGYLVSRATKASV